MTRKQRSRAESWLVALLWAVAFLSLAAAMFTTAAPILGVISFACACAAAFILQRSVLRPRVELERRLAAAIGRLDDPSLTDSTVDMIESAADIIRTQLPDFRTRLANLNAMIEAIADPVLATDSNGVVTICNRATEEFLESRSGSPLGRGVDELFTQTEILTLHSAAIAGRGGTILVRTPRADGVRIYEVVATPIALQSAPAPNQPVRTDGKEPGVVITLRDVTEHAQAVQLRAEFVANASHELRTPLASIKAAAETIQSGGGDDPALLDRLARMINVNAARLEDMVRDMLDLSRLETPELPVVATTVHLRELAESVAGMFEVECGERNLRIEVEIEPEAETIETDPPLLQLILKNLTDNATKFAFEGTTVRISARRVIGAGDRDYTRIQVTDEGIGIPLGQQHRIFERFYQVDSARSGQSKRRGTGLGLAIVKHAVKRLNGTISVESVWRHGTTMTVDVPITSAK